MLDVKYLSVTSDPWDELAKVIVLQAVEDWRELIRLGIEKTSIDGEKVDFGELRTFFRSEYCMALVDVDPIHILRRLERELEESINKEKEDWLLAMVTQD